MKALVFPQYFWPESFNINKVASTLFKKSIELEILTGKPNYSQGRVFDDAATSACHPVVAPHRGTFWSAFRADCRVLALGIFPRVERAVSNLGHLRYVFACPRPSSVAGISDTLVSGSGARRHSCASRTEWRGRYCAATGGNLLSQIV